MLAIAHSDCFIFDKVIHITVKVPSIRIAFSIGSLNGKYCLSEGHPRFLSIFPFVNLRITSIVLAKNMMPILKVLSHITG